ncbi:MAG TPA: aminotransferase class III-fold pyridoxal phosphate-dependent enzyme [Euzebya sp.]|nr:aminotransferase class III-fold pyridoxal phosphate-dependent enzyme [Euzebya sp.]
MTAAPPAYLHPFAKVGQTDFTTIVSGEGAEVIDDTGRRYVDALASLWYCNVGHGRGEIVDAVAQQMRTLACFHTFERFTNPAADACAEAIAALAPVAGSRVFLTSGGSEAVDTALKIARLAHAVAGQPQRRIIISRTPSYHGVTYGGMAATGLAANREHFGMMLPDVVQVPKDDLAAVDAVMTANPGGVAAVIAEPVIGAGGVHPPAPGYLQGLRALCDTHGAWLILDEVICGFGRLGHWWGAQRYDVRPDLTTFAKAVTSGYQPLGGVLVTPAVLDALAHDPEVVLRHGTTYSGHPAACAAALVALQITQQEGLLDRAGKVGARLSDGLHALHREDRVAAVRGEGAVWAVGLHDGDAVAVRDRMLDEGVIARPIGTDTIAFSPPLVISDEQVDRCIAALDAALGPR